MRESNVKEYELLRLELEALKNCITNYTGFVLGGSGIAVLGLAAVYQDSTAPRTGVGLGCLTLSIIISFVYSIMIYKFNSHNRFAGYGRLLASERWASVGRSEADLAVVLAWEYVIAALRRFEDDARGYWKICSSANFVGPMPDPVRESINPYQDLYRSPSVRKGIVALASAMSGLGTSRSWSFPPRITAVYAWLTFFFWAVGLLNVAPQLFASASLAPSLYPAIGLSAAGGATLVELILWTQCGRHLHSQMKGRETVDAYFWRLMPLRAHYLKLQGVTPEYIGVDIEQWSTWVAAEASKSQDTLRNQIGV